jgi:hypothetical protein
MSMIIKPDEAEYLVASEKLSRDPYRLSNKGLSFFPEKLQLGYGSRKGYSSIDPGIVKSMLSYLINKSYNNQGQGGNIKDYLSTLSPRASYYHPSGAGASLQFNAPSKLEGYPSSDIEIGASFNEKFIMDNLNKLIQYFK